MTRQLLYRKRNIAELRHKSNDTSQLIFIFKKLLLHRFMNVNNFQFDNELIDIELKNDEKNINCLIVDDLQKTNDQNIFYSNANAMLQETKKLTIIIYISIASFNVQIVNRKKNLQL